ncbi:MAG: hypothetical protein OHK0039_11490 [Bacteroidia bacterium]
MKAYNWSLFIALLFSVACAGDASTPHSTTARAATTAHVVRLEVLDFHTTHRCRSCLAIEKLTRETLDTYFATEQANGRIVFRLVDTDASENAALAERFGAFGTTLILNLEAGQRSQVRDITDFAFKRAWDRAQFQAELKAMIEEMLAQASVQG